MPSRAAVEQLRSAQAELARMARRDLRTFLRIAPLEPAALHEALTDFLVDLTQTYGEAATEVAATWVEENLPVRLPRRLPLGEVAGREQLARTSGWALRGDLTGDPIALRNRLLTEVSERLDGPVQRAVQSPGRRTLEQTAHAAGIGYARVPTGAETCAWCLMLASRGPVYERDSATRTRDGRRYHDDCVVPGTMVSGPETNAALARDFEGEVVTLTTASGRDLTVTPNHPVLTRRGWKPAGLLEEGDDLVRGPRVDRGEVSGPDEDHMPARVEDFVRALTMMLPSGGLRVPGAAEQFHGDGSADSEVDVIDVRDLLRHEVHAALGEPEAELQLEMAAGALSRGGQVANGSGSSELGVAGLGGSPHGLVRNGDLGHPFIGRHPATARLAGLTPGSDGQASFLHPAGDRPAGESGGLGERIDAFTLAVSTQDLSVSGNNSVRIVPVRRKFDPAVLYGSAEGVRVYAETGADLLERLAGSMEFDRLVDKRVSEYSGHVYNLSTVEGWYNANGITVSNCDCQPVPVASEDDYPEGYDPDALYEQYENARANAGGRTNSVLAQMRQDLDVR